MKNADNHAQRGPDQRLRYVLLAIEAEVLSEQATSPYIEVQSHGAGDLFGALFLGHFLMRGDARSALSALRSVGIFDVCSASDRTRQLSSRSRRYWSAAAISGCCAFGTRVKVCRRARAALSCGVMLASMVGALGHSSVAYAAAQDVVVTTTGDRLVGEIIRVDGGLKVRDPVY